MLDRGAGFSEVAVFLPVHLLVLERLHEGLTGRVVVRISLPAHADLNLPRFQQIGIILRGVLHPAVGMMDQTRRWRSVGQRHPQSPPRPLPFPPSLQHPLPSHPPPPPPT